MIGAKLKVTMDRSYIKYKKQINLIIVYQKKIE
jgi:hypothetical protein